MKKNFKIFYDHRYLFIGGFSLTWLIRLRFTEWARLGCPIISAFDDPRSLYLSWPLHKLVALAIVTMMMYCSKSLKKHEKENKEILTDFEKKLEILSEKEENGELTLEDLEILDDDNDKNDENIDDVDPINTRSRFKIDKATLYLILYIILSIITVLIWVFVK